MRPDEARAWVGRGVDEAWPDDVFLDIVRHHEHILWENVHHHRLHDLVSKMARGAVVLDAGCSTGILTSLAARSGAKAVIGLDIEPQRLHKASLRLADHAVPVLLACCDLQREWPLADASCDLIVCVEVLEHVLSERQLFLLQEARRVLRADGCLVLTTPNGERWISRSDPPEEPHWTPHVHWHEPTRGELERLLVAAGFSGTVDYYRYPKVHRLLTLRGYGRVARLVEQIPPRSRLGMNLLALASPS